MSAESAHALLERLAASEADDGGKSVTGWAVFGAIKGTAIHVLEEWDRNDHGQPKGNDGDDVR